MTGRNFFFRWLMSQIRYDKCQQYEYILIRVLIIKLVSIFRSVQKPFNDKYSK